MSWELHPLSPCFGLISNAAVTFRWSSSMQTLSQLMVYESGALTVVGFEAQARLDLLNLAECHEEVITLIRESQCKVLAIDLTGTAMIPSGLLGLMVAIHQVGVSVCLVNCSDELREVLEITKLNRFISTYRREL